jgi:ASC-1-like (ASCH) protein
MPEILHLNLHREFFDAIALKKKRIEYRERSAYWRKRLEGKKYDAILFRNGYSRNAPEMLVEFRGLRRYGQGRDAYYVNRRRGRAGSEARRGRAP